MTTLYNRKMSSQARSRKRQGITLIEIVVVLAIMGIVISAIVSVNIFGWRMFNSSIDRSDNQFDVRMPVDFISKEVRFAMEMTLISGPPEVPYLDSYRYIYVDPGTNELVYAQASSEDMLNVSKIVGTENATYSAVFSRSPDNRRNLVFTIGKPGTNQYDVLTEINILNIDKESEIIIDDTNPIGIKYLIPEAEEEADD